MSIDSINASASPEVQMNDGFTTLEHQAVYGKRPSTTTGLTWGYYGGRWGGVTVTAGTLSLTNAATNYIVVLKSTGAISVSTASTNWDNTELYARVYKLTTAGSVVTATEDHRAGLYGVLGFDTTVLAANEATDTSCFVAFVTAASGQLQIKTNTNLTFNSSTGMLTSLAATITTLTATNLSATVPTTGWYSPSADLIRTPNSVTVDDNAIISGTLTVSGAVSSFGPDGNQGTSFALAVSTANQTNGALIAHVNHATFTGSVIYGYSARASSSAFNLLNLLVSSGATSQFSVKGDGSVTAAGTLTVSGTTLSAQQFVGANATNTGFSANATTTNNWGSATYVNNGFANLILAQSGVQYFYRAVSGTAGNAVTWIETINISATSAVTLAGPLTTSAPVGGAGAWELGIANVVSPTSPNRTITIEIGGTAYYLAAKTTND